MISVCELKENLIIGYMCLQRKLTILLISLTLIYKIIYFVIKYFPYEFVQHRNVTDMFNTNMFRCYTQLRYNSLRYFSCFFMYVCFLHYYTSCIPIFCMWKINAGKLYWNSNLRKNGCHCMPYFSTNF